MIDDYQVKVLHRSQHRDDKPPKRHKCPVCQLEGHHGRTFQKILEAENTERANKFFKEMIEKQKIDSYISSLAKRQRHEFVQEVLDRIKVLSETAQESRARP